MKNLLFLCLLAGVLSLVTTSCETPPASGYTFNGGVSTQAGTPIGLNQNTLILYVRASDDATPALNTLRTNEQAEFDDVSEFFDESSFDQLSFNYTHAPNNGWYQLPGTYDDYMWTPADVAAATTPAETQAAQDGQDLVQDFMGFFTDALQAATNDGFNVGNFDQVAVVIIGPFHRGTSFGSANFTLTPQGGGADFQVSLPCVVVSTNTGWSRTAHEFGHAFGGFSDLYTAANRRMMNWDIMDCTDCTNQTTGFHKEIRAGWFGPNQVKTISRPQGTTQIVDNTTLVPLEEDNPSANDVLALKLDVGGGLFLYVENRQTLPGQTGSRQLPANGIIISDAIENSGDVNATRPPIQLFGGAITPGNTFTDNSYGPLNLEVTGSAPNLQVKTTWGPDPYYDLTITPWDPAPWESEDIWIDSEANGWDTYEFSNSSTNPNVAGNPVRNGDRPWVGRDNRVWARVHNTGSTDAANVRVNFYVNTPQGIGDAGNWSLLDRVDIPLLAAGTSELVRVNWRPQSAAATHTCLQVRIDHQPDELNANNNEAKENVTDFNTSSASPWRQITSSVEVANPTDRHQQVRMEMTGLPPNWTGWVSQRIVDLGPKETKVVRYRIDPNGGNPDGNEKIRIGQTYEINVEGWLLESDKEDRYGGITATVHTVRRFKSIDIISGPGFSNGDQTGPVTVDELAKPVIVEIAPGSNSMITLEITEKGTGTRQVFRAQAKSSQNGKAQASFNLRRLITAKQAEFRPGETYTMIAHLYGGNTVDGGHDSDPVSFVLQP
jgi:M6 family metalloprotease-like protein